MASYPSSIWSPATVVDDTTECDAAWANPLQAEIVAIETALGANLANVEKDIGAKVTSTAAQTITNNTTTAIAFDSEVYDTDGIHDNSTNNTRLTCKTAGKYHIVANLNYESDDPAVGVRMFGIYVDGTRVVKEVNDCVTLDNTTVSMSTIQNLAVNQYVEIKTVQNSGGNLNVDQNSYSPFFMMHLLSETT